MFRKLLRLMGVLESSDNKSQSIDQIPGSSGTRLTTHRTSANWSSNGTLCISGARTSSTTTPGLSGSRTSRTPGSSEVRTSRTTAESTSGMRTSNSKTPGTSENRTSNSTTPSFPGVRTSRTTTASTSGLMTSKNTTPGTSGIRTSNSTTPGTSGMRTSNSTSYNSAGIITKPVPHFEAKSKPLVRGACKPNSTNKFLVDFEPKPKSKSNTIGISTKSSSWLQGTVCKVRERAVFLTPVTLLPTGYTNKDVYMRPDAIGQSVLPIKKGDKIEFILGTKDKKKPMAWKVRLQEYAPRRVAELQEYLEQYLEKLVKYNGSTGRQTILLDTLPCRALWELLGDSIFPENPIKAMAYIVTLLELIVRLMELGKNHKKLIEGMISTLLQGALFQFHNDQITKMSLPEAIRLSPEVSVLRERVTDLCMGVARYVPDAARALLPSVAALCEIEPGGETRFLFDLLQMLLSTGGSCVPQMDLWNEMPLVPGSKELADQLVVKDPHLSRVKIGPETYSGSEEYMDTYFRLLRAETFASIQRGIKDLKNSELDPRDMHVYFKIQLSGYEVHNAVFSLALQFTPAKPVTKWEASPQLMFGNLLCLSPNRTFEDVIWATVSNRDTNLLNKSQLITVELLDCNTLSVSDVISSLQLNDGLTVMVESPTYFHALRPVLNSLQKFEMEDFPLKNEIVHAVSSSELPLYLNSAQTINTKAVEPKTADAQDVYVKEFLAYADRYKLLESSQSEALLHALNNRLAIVQGPPGCGKTFLGVKIVQLLLSLQPQLTGPVLLLTYKNHALDEFLKAMFQFCEKENIVRIGGRSKEPQLEECNLQTILKNERYTQARFNEIQDIRIAIGDKTEEIKSIAGTIRNSSFLTRESLLQEMSEAQVVSFIRDAGWNETLVYKASSKFRASREWVAKLVTSIEQVTTVKALVLHCFKEGVPKDNTDARYCFELFNKALETWIPDRKQLAQVREFQATFVQENYNSDVSTVDEGVRKIQGNDKKQQDDNSDDDYDEYDEEDVQALLEARLSSFGGDGREERKRDNLVLFEKNSAEVLVSLQDYPQNMEPSSAILAVENLWSLTGMQRLQFLYTILYNRSSVTADKLGELLAELEELRDRKQGIETNRKFEVLQSKKIVGLTITGASINHDLLQLLGPSVVIVEEAAEILEPSLLAALTPQLQHLILIGDHQQLRPNVDTYELTKNFDFDVSLMERLVKSNFPYKTLAKQNRMRPEFSALLKDIYPNLKDNLPRVSQNKPLGCLDKSMFFWTHNHPEKKERTITNEKEADMVASLVLYLLSSGCKPNEVTVLAAYSGQVKILRGKMKKHRIDYPELHPNDEQVTVQTIDMYQGDENKYVVVSLVRCNNKGTVGFLSKINRRCVAQSRAQCGMYFVGSADTLRHNQGRTCWGKLLTGMEEQECLASKITLQVSEQLFSNDQRKLGCGKCDS